MSNPTGQIDEFSHEITNSGPYMLERTIKIGSKRFVSSLPRLSDQTEPFDEWWLQVILGAEPKTEYSDTRTSEIRIADLFCGSGGFSLGTKMAAQALGMTFRSVVAVDTDLEALGAYRQNHKPTIAIGKSVEDVCDAKLSPRDPSRFYFPPELVGEASEALDGVDLVIAGPPCQGHSNLNNHTRRDDNRNQLYRSPLVFALAAGARSLLIENVPSVVHDRGQIVNATVDLISGSRWAHHSAVISASSLGWPQTRKRHFLHATESDKCTVPLAVVSEALREPARPLSWLISDLLDAEQSHFMNRSGELSAENQERISFLFSRDLHDLPDEQRPASHRNGHTYGSSYGRLHWDRPAGTITTGFMTPGRGRFIHPLAPRTLTPREAARIQGFPDTYLFGKPNADPGRTHLAKWIGDAVPSIIGYAAALSALTGHV